MSDLTAGPELDARVRVEVFGLPLEYPEHELVDCSEWTQSSFTCNRCGDYSGWVTAHEWKGPCRPLLSYSSSIAAAWTVVERMAYHGYRLDLEQDDERRHGTNAFTKLIHMEGEADHKYDAWVATFTDGEGGSWDELVHTDRSVCVAICRAALGQVAREKRGERVNNRDWPPLAKVTP